MAGLSVIDYARKRRDSPNNSDYERLYWSAYIDGASAQRKEDEVKPAEGESIVGCGIIDSKERK